MIIGRKAERRRLDALLDSARAGRSGALVLRGEAGIGKTALLEYAIESAEGFRVLRALGVESEAEVAFAGVQQLVQPIIGLLTELPSLQASALSAALAIEDRPAPDRLAVSAATLTLLAAAADERPLLCVVDDAHWLDHPSAEALTFAARRVHAEGVVILFAAREPEKTAFSAPGIADLRLEGLTRDAAKALLDVGAPDLAETTAALVIELTAGNPLALLEIPRALDSAHRAGRAPLAEPLPVDTGIERAFLERAAMLSRKARSALLLAAAGDPGDRDALWAALEARGLAEDPVAESEAAGLLAHGRLDFCHPLARSAIYQAARPAERHSAHRALAETTREPDRRAWHLAAAAEDPDEGVAELLEEAAEAASRRGGASAEARALERAARLTPDAEAAARRLLRAAFAFEAAGWLELAETMLAEVAETTHDPALRSQAVARRSYLLFDRGDLDRAYAVAVDEAGRAAPDKAAFLLTASGVVHVLHHKLDIPSALATAERAWQLAGPAAADDLDLCRMLAWTRGLSGQVDEARALARSIMDRVDPGTVLAIDCGTDLLYLEDYPRALEVLERVVERTRAAGALGILSYALDQLARYETRVGNLTRAYSLELECLQVTEPLGNDVALAGSLAWLGHIEAMLGRADSRTRGERALAIAEEKGSRWNCVRARVALGLEKLAAGDAAAAVKWLEPAVRMTAEGHVGHPNFFRTDPELIEALARLGRAEQAEPHLARLEEQAKATGSGWGRATAARCRGLLTRDTDVAEAFEAALDMHDHDPSAFERARTELCYGERLRRAGARRRAREQLRSALQTLERLGASPWAERARIELRATGEHVRRRDPGGAEQLTPQEFQIALLVAEGLTNREIAARLFLSPKTVEFHLSRVFRKLGVRSRGELIRLFAVRAPESLTV